MLQGYRSDQPYSCCLTTGPLQTALQRREVCNIGFPDLEYQEFRDKKDLPFEVDRDDDPDSTIKKVKATRSYAARFPDPLALKVVRLALPDFGQDIELKERDSFIKEARALRNARHRHVVRFAMAYSFQSMDTAYFAIAMDRAEGDIDRYLKFVRPPETINEISTWFGCLAKALAYIHGIGIRHRDIKPTNILIKGQSVLLADFGISKMGLGRTLSTTVPQWEKGRTPQLRCP